MGWCPHCASCRWVRSNWALSLGACRLRASWCVRPTWDRGGSWICWWWAFHWAIPLRIFGADQQFNQQFNQVCAHDFRMVFMVVLPDLAWHFHIVVPSSCRIPKAPLSSSVLWVWVKFRPPNWMIYRMLATKWIDPIHSYTNQGFVWASLDHFRE